MTLIYTDAAGNKLFKKFIKSRKSFQYSAKNANGQLVNERGVLSLAKMYGKNINLTGAKTIYKTKSGMKSRMVKK